MKRVDDIYQKIIALENLHRAARKALRNKKRQADAQHFRFHLEGELLQLHEELKNEVYTPRPYREFKIFEPKERIIACSELRDRVVHHALCHYLEPIFERRLIFHTYACRLGKGTHRAVGVAQKYCRVFPYFLKCDIAKYFPSIDHQTLKNLLRRLLKDEKALKLCFKIIDRPEQNEKGLPIGNLTSQYFANLYLGELDLFVKNDLRVDGYLRYMDDFILFGEKELMPVWFHQIKVFLWERLRLHVNERVSFFAPTTQGLPFLGFRIFENLIRIRRENLIRMRRKVKNQTRRFQEGKIDEVEFTASVASMMAHITHANTLRLRQKEFC